MIVNKTLQFCLYNKKRLRTNVIQERLFKERLKNVKNTTLKINTQLYF